MFNLDLILTLFILALVVFNLIFLIKIRRISVLLGGDPPGLHIHKLMRYVHIQSQHPSGRKLKPWIFVYFTANAIGFILFITLCALMS